MVRLAAREWPPSRAQARAERARDDAITVDRIETSKRLARRERDEQTSIISRTAWDPDVFEVFVTNTVAEFEHSTGDRTLAHRPKGKS